MKALYFIFIFSIIIKAQYYVSPVGDDNNSGTITHPFKTIKKALDMMKTSGDTIYLREGVYLQNVTLEPPISGSENRYKYLLAYPGEHAIIDFSGQEYSSSNRGLKLTKDYWHILALEIMNAGDNGIHISGHNNIVENCSIHHNKDTGLQISNGGSYNHIINCDSYLNYDPNTHGENADGFAPKLDVGPGNYFNNCRAYNNSDDGWDCYESQYQIIIDSCWSFHNGYNIWNDNSFQGDRNGHKLGGNYVSANIIIRNSIAFDNIAKGFDQNHNTAGITIYNCTSWRNGINFSLFENPKDGIHVLKNNISFEGSFKITNSSIEEKNSWNGFNVTDKDFLNLDTSFAKLLRDEKFRIQKTNFLHLAQTSSMIDAGTDVGIKFFGLAPDLGAFEFEGISTLVVETQSLQGLIKLYQNYPNPFNPTTIIKYSIPNNEKLNSETQIVKLKVHDVLGKDIATLINEPKQPGEYEIKFNASFLSSGVYYYSLSYGNYIMTQKMIVMK